MKNIAIVVGTRPEVIKLIPIYLELQKREGVNTTLICTGQHKELAEDALGTFGCQPDIVLNTMQPNQTLVSLTSRLLVAIDNELPSDTDLIIVQGDTASTFAASLLAFYRGIGCAHVEAGLRSGSIYSPFPEEFNRRAVSLTARWHFAPTDVAARNLANEGVRDGVHVVGNTSIDAAVMIAGRRLPITPQLRTAVPELDDHFYRIVLITAHRRENFGAGIDSIIAGIRCLASERPDFVFVWPIHPNPKVRDVVHAGLADIPNVRLLDPLGYSDLLHVLERSYMALSDSGGIQEEAPTFACPVLIMRETTERPEAIDAGCNLLVGTEATKIISAFNEIADNAEKHRQMADAQNPYGDGRASQRIVDILLTDN